MSVTCFWLEPIGRTRLSLRRYVDSSDDDKCPLPFGYHNAKTALCEVEERKVPDEGNPRDWHYHYEGPRRREDLPTDAPWPESCACGYRFQESDNWQVFSEHLHRRSDTGGIVTLIDAPPGAMWNAEYLAEYAWAIGPDGRAIHVRCPNGRDWHIDGRASNCTMPDDTAHKCWVRHGEPPNLTVDKDGVTCAAGGGSIQAGDYHGFLRGGVFT